MRPLRALARLSFQRRLALSMVGGMLCAAVVGGIGLQAVSQVRSAAHQMARSEQVARDHLAADMMHDALRADLLAALVAGTPSDTKAAVAETAVHAELARRSLGLVATGISAGQFAPRVQSLSASVQLAFAKYIGLVEQVVARASSDRLGARAQSAAALALYQSLERDNAALTEQLGVQIHREQVVLDGHAREGTVRTGVLAVLAVVCMVFFATWIRRAIVATLRIHGDTHAQLQQTHGELAQLAQAMQLSMDRHQFVNQLHDAFDMVGQETDAREVVRVAFAAVSPGGRTELLLADNSRAHLSRAVDVGFDAAPGCGVDSPWGCVAARRGTPMTFPSSTEINACPQLRDRPEGACSAVCVPVTFMGKPLGVVHSVGTDGSPPDAEVTERLALVAAEAGSRLGTMRALAKTQLQAATDVLTGLSNRRTLEERVRPLIEDEVPIAVAIGDLDHFKQINDTFGHDAGDRALRAFSAVLQASVRPDDIIARYGGEEFVIVLPGSSAADAAHILERAREALARALAAGDHPAFTVSFGVVASDGRTSFADLVSMADAALLLAKQAGRDRVVVAGSSPLPVPRVESDGAAADVQPHDGAALT